MITLTFILVALVLLTSWDAAEADDNIQAVPVRTDDESTRLGR